MQDSKFYATATDEEYHQRMITTMKRMGLVGIWPFLADGLNLQQISG
jgi:hypothetical protein